MSQRSSVKYAMDMAKSIFLRRPHLSLAFIYPTYRCNLRCVYCQSSERKTPELSSSEWHSVIEQLSQLGCWRITILGGEPLLREDISDIILHIRDRGMSCILTSNALLVPEMVNKIKRINTLVLSLDTPGPNNDLIRGRGTFSAVKEAIAAATQAGIPVKINAVLSDRTILQLDEMLEFIESNDLKITFNTLRKDPFDLLDAVAEHTPSEDVVRKVLLRLADLSRRNPRILFSPMTFRLASRWPDFSVDRYETPSVSDTSSVQRSWPRCHAGRYYMSIDPQGNVFPCVVNQGKIVGKNIVEEGVKSGWESLFNHTCVACHSPCLVELNQLFSMKAPVLFNFVVKYFRRLL